MIKIDPADCCFQKFGVLTSIQEPDGSYIAEGWHDPTGIAAAAMSYESYEDAKLRCIKIIEIKLDEIKCFFDHGVGRLRGCKICEEEFKEFEQRILKNCSS